MSKTKRQRPKEDYKDSPVAWFMTLLTATREADREQAEVSRRELDRLGWRVSPRRKHGPPKGGVH